MHFGRQVFKAGDSINIDAGVQYRFKTGPQGLRDGRCHRALQLAGLVAAGRAKTF